ncbi:MAG TPA: hypothetical protein VKY59_05580, partial [Spirillospora sp.]|nr:hypothetical protein [Spirillospora sp.]
YYFVDTEDGTIIDEGWLQLGANETLPLNLGPQVGPVRLVVGDWLTYAFIECFASTEEPTPTEEVTPEVTPTEEPTPEVTPTEEVTPDVTPTEEPTPEPTEEPTPEPTEEPTPEVTPTEEVTPEPPQEYNCQKSNPDRLDCSSIEVTAYCDGPTAVFVITNTGEPGEGDMSVPTEYRLIQNGSVIESGEVQLGGGETMLVYYSGGGRITLEADQQIGHPGQSQPQATISCGG